jgi:hypothetical protein
MTCYAPGITPILENSLISGSDEKLIRGTPVIPFTKPKFAISCYYKYVVPPFRIFSCKYLTHSLCVQNAIPFT